MNYAVKRKLVKFKWLVPNAASALLPMNDEIVLESNPDMSCNTYALYQFFLKKGLNSKYKLTWIVDDPEQFKDIKIKNVSFIARNPSNPIDRMKLYVRINRAKAAIRQEIRCTLLIMQRGHAVLHRRVLWYPCLRRRILPRKTLFRSFFVRRLVVLYIMTAESGAPGLP